MIGSFFQLYLRTAKVDAAGFELSRTAGDRDQSVVRIGADDAQPVARDDQRLLAGLGGRQFLEMRLPVDRDARRRHLLAFGQ